MIACVPRPAPGEAAEALEADLKRHARSTTLALWAAEEALRDGGWRPSSDEERDAAGVVIGVGMSFTADLADAGLLLGENRLRRLSPHFVPRILANSAAGAVGLAHGLRGPTHCPSTACATGAHALGDAARMIALGDADVMLAGGAEACVDAIALAAFGRLKALSTARNDARAELASRPFDAERDGCVMGEGAGVMLLESEEHARARGARVYAEVGAGVEDRLAGGVCRAAGGVLGHYWRLCPPWSTAPSSHDLIPQAPVSSLHHLRSWPATACLATRTTRRSRRRTGGARGRPCCARCAPPGATRTRWATSTRTPRPRRKVRPGSVGDGCEWIG